MKNQNGLYFKLYNIKYNNLEDLVFQLDGFLEKNETRYINIEWCWDYQGNDTKDTLDGIWAKNYSFELSAISEKLH